MKSKRVKTAKRERKSGLTPPARLTQRKRNLVLPKLCVAKTRAGAPCPQQPLPGRTLCFFHTPGNASAYGAKGGRRRARYLAEPLETLDAPRTATDVQALLARTLAEVRAGRLDPKIATCMFYGCSAYLKATELTELEARLAMLEAGSPAGAKPPNGGQSVTTAVQRFVGTN
jgi:hypothetical protein